MSHHIAPAFHPKTGTITDATWLDNHFGVHVYGVRFDGDDKVYRSIECSMEAAAVAIDGLRVALEWYASGSIAAAEDGGKRAIRALRGD